ncbi:uncharacterized protein N7479_000360 [Penicillium vulpinum]|uniref:uncharacterized protein n=1 Tax=Penicillium vulpinum TaxID=29845 RepID=UPI002546E5F3|nr:uncharacterized protein N7479_000360 [Penicillium vulpinum]KAJ5970442.1 hypothetical protein N7479_000360 [Penicillium vulpinum]
MEAAMRAALRIPKCHAYEANDISYLKFNAIPVAVCTCISSYAVDFWDIPRLPQEPDQLHAASNLMRERIRNFITAVIECGHA